MVLDMPEIESKFRGEIEIHLDLVSAALKMADRLIGKP